MNEAKIELPHGVNLNVPSSDNKVVPDSAVFSGPPISKGELLIRWDGNQVQFITSQGAIAYEWGRFEGFNVSCSRVVMGQRLCQFEAAFASGFRPILYYNGASENEFKLLVGQIAKILFHKPFKI